jgi:enolase
MKLTLFNRKKYLEAIRSLKKRNAPDYVLQAYEEGYAKVVNEYYKIKLERIRNKNYKYSLTESTEYTNLVKKANITFLESALKKSDIDFIKAFFQMTNLDIVTGEKLPPNASKLINQGIIKDLGLKDLYKKLR